MRGGWNPVRRNRNIGTPLCGRGQNNVFLPPLVRQPIVGVRTVEHRITSGHEIRFITEETLPGFLHACTVEDVVCALAALPPEDVTGIHAIVFRQLTRKERMLSPRWGQITFGAAGANGVAHDATVSLVAVQECEPVLWPASIIPADSAELDRLRQDGHTVHLTDHGWEIVSPVHAVRLTQLCRTLPHEVGHWVDYRACAARGTGYDARPHLSKESFADQYAATMHGRVATALTTGAA